MHWLFQNAFTRILAGLLVLGFSISCSSTDVPKETPKKVKNNLKDPVSTPRTSMGRFEYPFDSAGNYLGSNALQWERMNGNQFSSDQRKYARTKKSSSKSKWKPKPKPKPKKSSSSSSASSKPKETKRYYVVQKGDTLWSISRKYSNSVGSIKALTGLKSDSIRPGQRLRVK